MENYTMDLLEYDLNMCRNDSSRLSNFGGNHEEFAMPQLKLSRNSSNASQKPFKVHATQREPDHEIRHLFTMGEQFERQTSAPIPEFSMCDEVQHTASTTVEDMTIVIHNQIQKPILIPITEPTESTELIHVAIRMVNEQNLAIIDYKQDLEPLEKMFLSNILYLKNGAKVTHELDTPEFLTKVNECLGDSKTKRNDDRLRFVYKRAIKWLLQKCSGYEANKLHRMQDYEVNLVNFYFEKYPDIRTELMDTSFASKKKLQKLFKLSPQFKDDFIWFTQYQMESFYTKYTQETYATMLKILSARYVKGEIVPQDFLYKHYKRLPWRAADVTSTVRQISTLNLE
jgi:hypothetical protein